MPSWSLTTLGKYVFVTALAVVSIGLIVQKSMNNFAAQTGYCNGMRDCSSNVAGPGEACGQVNCCAGGNPAIMMVTCQAGSTCSGGICMSPSSSSASSTANSAASSVVCSSNTDCGIYGCCDSGFCAVVDCGPGFTQQGCNCVPSSSTSASSASSGTPECSVRASCPEDACLVCFEGACRSTCGTGEYCVGGSCVASSSASSDPVGSTASSPASSNTSLSSRTSSASVGGLCTRDTDCGDISEDCGSCMTTTLAGVCVQPCSRTTCDAGRCTLHWRDASCTCPCTENSDCGLTRCGVCSRWGSVMMRGCIEPRCESGRCDDYLYQEVCGTSDASSQSSSRSGVSSSPASNASSAVTSGIVSSGSASFFGSDPIASSASSASPASSGASSAISGGGSSSSQALCREHCGRVACGPGETCYVRESDFGVSVGCFTGPCPASMAVSECFTRKLVPPGLNYISCATVLTNASSSILSLSRCGDSVLQPGEECDSGLLNGLYSDSCTTSCKKPTGCGDGRVERPAEECDRGRNNSNTNGVGGCRTDCTVIQCGDGVVDTHVGEECEDGNTTSGDGCNSQCKFPFCNDRYVDPGEECDWGYENCNVSHNTGASNTCSCRADECTVPRCGDGILDQWVAPRISRFTFQGEQCDDGNINNGDGCEGDCTLTVSCGDYVCNGGENCGVCAADCGVCKAECGNGILEIPEQCDDGNGANDDGCDAQCIAERGFHSECNAFGRCIVVEGLAGDPDTCSAHVPCGGPTHTVCDQANRLCKDVDGAGQNECVDLGDCPVLGGTKCENFQCVPNPGGDALLCTNDSDCGHLECASDDSCIQVAGKATDTCGSSLPPCGGPSHTVCNYIAQTCDVVNTAGVNECDTFNECPIDEEHLTCIDNTCVSVSGKGLDTCNTSTSCVPDNKYTACENGACVEKIGNADNGCTLTPDNCPPACTHLACVDSSCQVVQGNASNECTSDSECGHLDCINNACTLVSGGGFDTCNDSTSCIPDQWYTVRENSACVQKLGNLDNGCTVDPDNCPPAGTHLACVDSSCQVVNGDEPNDCTNDSQCMGKRSSSSAGGIVAAGAVFGDGVLALPEECDDGNRRDNDGCSAICRSEAGSCGDGILQALLHEQCEQATHNAALPYACVDCRFRSYSCGDGVLDDSEECDLGQQNAQSPDAQCRTDCSFPYCGDGIVDGQFFEACDDGNNENEDGCDRYCVVEEAVHPSAITPGCGNGTLEPPEQCDDGNAAGNDGCSAECNFQFGAPNTVLSPEERSE